MSNSMALTDPYRVKRGDTLGSISKRCGRSISDLQKFNNIKNPNALTEGQALNLSEQSAFGITVLFLDALRHPIESLKYRFHFDGSTVHGATGTTGVAPRQVTKNAKSEFEVWVCNAEQQWQQVMRTTSDYGHKLLTLVSNAIVIKGKTDIHPQGAPLVPVKPAGPAATQSGGSQVPLPKKTAGSPSKNNPNVKQQDAKGPQGQPIIKIGVDLPQGLLDLFANYTGGDISEAQWNTTAAALACEPEVLKAIARVESGGRSAFWRLNSGNGAFVPAIMYERHYFSRLTKRQYDQTHPDISWPTGYRTKKNLGHADSKMPDGKVEQLDIYSNYATSYLRLINAYQLDAEAALKSCSWGKFQVMGANFATCKAFDIKSLVTDMCISELKQIVLLSAFIQNKPATWKNPKNKKLGKEITLHAAVKAKNWSAIAFNYNGPGYKTYSYDTKLKEAYESFKSKA